jgi:putative membrane protein (TIGR04086 family)
MKKAETVPVAQILAIPVLLGFGATLLLMALGSLLVLSGKAENQQIPVLARGCLGIGCLSASFLAARRAAGRRLLWGIAAGGLLFVCLALLSLLWIGEPINLLRILGNFAISVITTLSGGMLGAGMKRKKTNGRKYP